MKELRQLIRKIILEGPVKDSFDEKLGIIFDTDFSFYFKKNWLYKFN